MTIIYFVFNRLLLVLGIIFLALGSVQAADPIVYYCVMKKKVSIDGNGRVKNYELTTFKFKDERVMDHGTGSIILGKGLEFPNRFDNKLLKPYIYYDKDMWRGFLQEEALMYYFKDNELFLSTQTSTGLLSIVSQCERF